MRRGWELLALLIIGAYLLKLMLAFIQPLIPYMVIVVVLALVGLGVYGSKRRW